MPVLSSSGKDTYPVAVHGTEAGCPCRGFRYYGKCRHGKKCLIWLDAIIPPCDLPG